MQKHNNRGVRRRKPPEIPLTEIMRHVVQDLTTPLGVDLSLKLSLILEFKPEEFRSVVEHETRNAETSLAEGGFDRYVALRQVEALVSKNPDWYGIEPKYRREAALQGFFDSEESCRRANRRIRWFKRRTSRLPETMRTVFAYTGLLVQEILGRLDEATWGEILDSCDHGPGATFGHRVQTGCLAEKLDPSYKHTTTREALPLLLAYGARNPHWINYLCAVDASYELVNGNRVSVVPKKWNKDRTIGIEPSINVFLQKGVGDVVAKRLSRIGIDLRDQRRNQRMARLGSISQEMVTLDLSAASDSLCIEAVEWLLPGDWFSLMDSLRSKEFQVGRTPTWHRYEKFSSMGNGFTFPLETLIFYAVAKSSCLVSGSSPSGLTVFGDDIVVPTDAALLTVEALRFLGFRVNQEKSHYFGPFRESCGTDYVHGVDVRPVYIKGKVQGRSSINDIHNRLLIGSAFELAGTCSYIRDAVPGHPVPGDFGLALLDEEGWFPGKSVKLSAGYIADSPDPSGYCTSAQSDYFTFQEFCEKRKPVEESRFHWYSNYLAFLCGTPGEVGLDVSRPVRYTREGFSFTWLSVSDIRDQRSTRRLSQR